MFKLVVILLVSVVSSSHQAPNGRIIGGQPANAGEFPWHAAIFVTGASSHTFCSGALISNQHILTAAQCVYGATLFVVHLGTTSIDPAAEHSTRIVAATSNKIIHPDYKTDSIENDIAIIRLHMALTLTAYIQPIPVIPDDVPAETPVTITGYGQTSAMTPGPVNDLNFVDLVTISNTECQSTYGSAIQDGMLCAVGNNDEGFCTGDSGGALVATHSIHQFYVAGIASFLSGNGCETPEPTGYTRVSAYYDWIQSTIQI